MVQFQYLTWPDFGTPPSAEGVLDLLHEVRQYQAERLAKAGLFSLRAIYAILDLDVIGGGGANGEMANLTNEKGKFAIAIFRHFSPFFAIGSF